MIYMKLKITVLLLTISFSVMAQQEQHLAPPGTYWQSFGFQKQVEQVGVGYYKSDSLGYEPAMLELYTFNKEGHLTQKYIRIFGKYGSETAYNYVYNKGILDSINTVATASNFNSRQKLHYNNNGQIKTITATGKHTNFTDTYTYDNSGMVAAIVRQYKSGGIKKTTFNHTNNYVYEQETDVKGKVTGNYYIYDGDERFASFSSDDKKAITFYDTYHRKDFKTVINEDALKYVLKQRQQKQLDPKTFAGQMDKLQGKPVSVILFDIPAEARNESGDWIKRLQVDKRLARPERRLVFKKLVYTDGTESGSTDYDMIFGKKVSAIQ